MQATLSTLITGFLPPHWVFTPPLFWRGRRRRRRENFGDLGWFFIDFLSKIDDFEAKTSFFSRLRRIPFVWGKYFPIWEILKIIGFREKRENIFPFLSCFFPIFSEDIEKFQNIMRDS